MNPSPCSPCGTVPQAVNIPGSPGNDGAPGPSAYSTISTQFTVPAVGATVLVSLLNTGWLVVGQAVMAGQGLAVVANPGPATFRVVQVVSPTVVNLRFLGYASDVAPGSLISSGAILTAGGAFGNLAVVAKSSPADPTGTASTAAYVMMGLAGSVTPVLSGRVLILITGMAGNSTLADGCNMQISYGTGAAPANAAALSGTQVGAIKKMVASTAAGKQGFALAFVVTGLVAGTAYWIDLAVEAVTGGTASVYNVDIVAIEL